MFCEFRTPCRNQCSANSGLLAEANVLRIQVSSQKPMFCEFRCSCRNQCSANSGLLAEANVLPVQESLQKPMFCEFTGLARRGQCSANSQDSLAETNSPRTIRVANLRVRPPERAGAANNQPGASSGQLRPQRRHRRRLAVTRQPRHPIVRPGRGRDAAAGRGRGGGAGRASVPAPSPLGAASVPAPSPLGAASVPAPSRLGPRSIPPRSPLHPPSVPPRSPLHPPSVPPRCPLEPPSVCPSPRSVPACSSPGAPAVPGHSGSNSLPGPERDGPGGSARYRRSLGPSSGLLHIGKSPALNRSCSAHRPMAICRLQLPGANI
ncbi:uncharacterized protein LOC128793620 [Vidua chalybeata]|uniref:uncharacterized protein LOC128793620 n=1 Tax=Vidua chalybeata TaxID=81927 RepID=UPI0023A7E0D3|nr:uncharacterized protein LOC128793620 [Vidua chalybeata]